MLLRTLAEPMVTSRIERASSGLEEPQEAGPQIVWNPGWVLEWERDTRGH